MKTFRWICILPVAGIVHILFSTFFYNIQHAVGWFGLSFIFIRISMSAFCGLMAGVRVAPTHRIETAWILAGLYTLLGVGIIIHLVLSDVNRVRWIAGLIEAFSLPFGAVGAAIQRLNR
ncbi:MAG: hypothetical protein NTZ46_10265 [Verrucomicrobia bacterium]|nr:hypothetical protein [Verrucomicrobiota bacterium]